MAVVQYWDEEKKDYVTVSNEKPLPISGNGGSEPGAGEVTIGEDRVGLARQETLTQMVEHIVSMEQAINELRDKLQSGQGIDAVTPDDDADLPGGETRALILGTAGDVRVTMANGSQGVLPLQAGFNQLSVRRVHATDTTVDNVIAVY